MEASRGTFAVVSADSCQVFPFINILAVLQDNNPEGKNKTNPVFVPENKLFALAEQRCCQDDNWGRLLSSSSLSADSEHAWTVTHRQSCVQTFQLGPLWPVGPSANSNCFGKKKKKEKKKGSLLEPAGSDLWLTSEGSTLLCSDEP